MNLDTQKLGFTFHSVFNKNSNSSTSSMYDPIGISHIIYKTTFEIAILLFYYYYIYIYFTLL